MIPKKVYISIAVWDDGRKYDFIEVSERPHQIIDKQCQWREYTDLSQVWHDASEEPQGRYEILVQDGFGNFWLTNYAEDISHYQRWEECVVCECIDRWAYISDLLPKGGKR